MIFSLKFKEQDSSFHLSFGEVTAISDGGYDSGYKEGYKVGEETGYTKGHNDGYNKGFLNGLDDGYDRGYSVGLSERTYETWTITLVDGTVIDKEVALL